MSGNNKGPLSIEEDEEDECEYVSSGNDVDVSVIRRM